MKTPGPGRTKVKLNLYLDPKVVVKLGALAAERDIARSEVVERAVEALPVVEHERKRCRKKRARRKQKNGNNHTGV